MDALRLGERVDRDLIMPWSGVFLGGVARFPSERIANDARPGFDPAFMADEFWLEICQLHTKSPRVSRRRMPFTARVVQ